jgi:hypothetical protein
VKFLGKSLTLAAASAAAPAIAATTQPTSVLERRRVRFTAAPTGSAAPEGSLRSHACLASAYIGGE